MAGGLPPSPLTIPRHWVELWQSYLAQVGIPSNQLLHQCGLAVHWRPDSEISLTRFEQMHAVGVRLLQQRDIALVWNAGVGGEHWRMLCLSLAGASTLREVLLRAAQFGLLAPSAPNQLLVEPDRQDGLRIEFSIRPSEACTRALPRWHVTEEQQLLLLQAQVSGLRFWYRLLCWLADRLLVPSQVALPGDPEVPWFSPSRFQRWFSHRCSVTVGGERALLVFDAQQLAQPIVRSPRQIETMVEQPLTTLLEHMRALQSVRGRVRELLESHHGHELPSLSALADQLGVTPARLRRLLRDESTGYREIKDHYYRAQALRLLADHQLTLTEIAARLGMDQLSVFNRRCQRWFGSSPSKLRDELWRLGCRADAVAHYPLS